MDLTHTNYPTGVNEQTITIYDFLPIHQRYTIVDNAQLLTIPSEPIILLPALGENLLTFPVLWSRMLNTSAGLYTNASAAQWYICWGDGTQASGYDGNIKFYLENTPGISFGLSPGVTSLGSFLTGDVEGSSFGALATLASVNQPLILRDDWNAGDYEDGNVANSCKFGLSFLIYNIETGIFV